jgi:hypothetical protein
VVVNERVRAIASLEVDGYRPHALHAEDRAWIEKNCYIDVWIELLHALGLEPTAMLPFTLAVDFEGDHWTFYKPPHSELRALYGVDVQELNVWRPLVEHAQEHLAQGKLISTEADSYWLPDTAGTDYRTQHTKTTIILNDLDVQQQRLGYFHNAGYHWLDGEDFRQVFRIGFEHDPTFMPLFAELVRVDGVVQRPPQELAALSARLMREHLAYRPQTNPVRRFGDRFERDLPALLQSGLPHYHAWAFATLRQLGSAFELAAAHLRWLAAYEGPVLEQAAQRFDAIALGSKGLVLKIARAVNAKRPLDASAAMEEMAQAWDDGIRALDGARSV